MPDGHFNRALVVGAGIGGLSTAIELAIRGHAVTVLERAARPGGKMRELWVAGRAIDAGPTVLTMRWVFDELFEAAGRSLDAYVELTRPERLARHAWAGGGRLDLYADLDRSADAVGALAGPREAQGYRDFSAYARRIYEAVEAPFLRSQRPTLLSVARLVGRGGLGALTCIDAYATMWSALGRYFRDPRLRQLFGRYATYCGSSPFLAPATLNLVAHVEREGVWLVAGGMYRLAEALARLAAEIGVTVRCGAEVASIDTRSGRAEGVTLASGEVLRADAIVMNGDPNALAAGRLGADVARGAPRTSPSERSLSAVTSAMVARTRGFDLARHNVFFSSNYEAEFRALDDRRVTPEEPTVYVCAHDREGAIEAARGAAERLLLIVNAPADGDAARRSGLEADACEQAAIRSMRRCGLEIAIEASQRSTPRDFEALFPGSGGALYGRASHGPMAPFQRSGARTRTRGLYLAGGAVHPGAGVPMAALSGRLAAAAVTSDGAATRTSRGAAMRGATSTR